MTDKIVKPVAFNRRKDATVLNWLGNRPFSPYVKRLIRADMTGGGQGGSDWGDDLDRRIEAAVRRALGASPI